MRATLKSRKTIRLPGFNYASAGRYFITICTFIKEPYLGDIGREGAVLSDAGRMVLTSWKKISELHPYVEVDEFIIMPNHMHGILTYRDTKNETIESASPLPDIIRNFKAYTGREFAISTNGLTLWQRGYFEHIIRDDFEYVKIKKYIKFNPVNWLRDK